MEPHRGRWTIDRQPLLSGLGPLRRRQYWLAWASWWLFEQLLQLLTPLLLLPLKLQQLLLPTLLQLLLEPLFLLPPLLFFFFFFFFPSLTLFFFLLPPLLDGVKPDGPRHLFCDIRGLDLFFRGAGILRDQIATGLVADGDGVPHTPRLGRLGASLLLLETRHLDPPW
jgi:hypothetical protein